MTKDQVIAAQAKQLYKFRREAKRRKEAMRRARIFMIGIGGPLNDNKLGFTKEQLRVFDQINAELGP